MNQKKHIASTIVLTIFLALCIYIVVTLFQVDSGIDTITEGINELDSSVEGAFITYSVLAWIDISLYLVSICFCIGGFIIALVCFFFALAGRKSCLKPVRIINLIYTALFGYTAIFCVIKFILILR